MGIAGDAHGDIVIDGETGYWQHVGNVLSNGTDRTTSPMTIDLLLSEQGRTLSRHWTRDLDPDVIEHVFTNRMVEIRVIVPPAAYGAAIQTIIEDSLALGVQIRVFPSTSEFTLLDNVFALLRDEDHPDDTERHRLTRKHQVVDPLKHLFETHWAAAVPWQTFVRGGNGILQLLAQGWTDSRIAEALGSSPRTVSRRISELMEAAGAQSRFELGMKYALHGENLADPATAVHTPGSPSRPSPLT